MSVKTKPDTLDISWRNFTLALSKRTHIAGILNRTPDSFSDGGFYMKEEDAISRALKMVSEGADIIDIGGESTRPGAEPVTVDTELSRTIPVIRGISRKIGIPISIDTRKSEVAEEALKNGAAIINDITGLQGDSRMAGVAAKFDVPVIVMHIRGTPRTMQLNPRYDFLIDEISNSLKKSIWLAKNAGIDENKIIIDPGIGFGKTTRHNLKILNNLESFKVFGKPILLGLSRKSYIANTLKTSNIKSEYIEMSGRLMGTAASCSLAISKGANILRVHDVKEIVQAVRMADAIIRS
ncbi:MAG: dihydropteroate synthase [Candidatus Omnitrophota bacterium]|nr:dihydropteroate synthase [Candidatus Omnitrophota bacterium]